MRQAFDLLLREHDRAMGFVARYIGGVYVNRDHKGDPERPAAVGGGRSRRSSARPWTCWKSTSSAPRRTQFPTKLYNYLAPSYWNHWGMKERHGRTSRPRDVLACQDHVLAQVLSPVTLARLIDSEIEGPRRAGCLHGGRIAARLTAAIFRETEKLQEGKFTDRKPAISSLRRNLQRRYSSGWPTWPWASIAPSDCQAVAAAELEALEARLKQVLAGKAELDTYTRSHLSELVARIHKVLDARLELKRP